MPIAIILRDVVLTDTGLPRIAVDSASLAVTSLKGLRFWLAPEDTFNVGGTRTDRFAGLKFSPVGSAPATGTMSGAPAFVLPGTPLQILNNGDDGASSMPDPLTGKYTIATVIQASAATNALQAIFGGPGVDRGNGVLANRQIFINAGNNSVGAVHVVNGNESVTGTGPDVGNLLNPTVFMITYDGATQVAKYFINGVQKGTSSLNRFNPRGFTVGAAAPGNFSPFVGKMGDVLSFTEDYSAPGFEADKARLEGYLKSKYSIA